MLCAAIGSLSQAGAPTIAASGMITSDFFNNDNIVDWFRTSANSRVRLGCLATDARLGCRYMKLSTTVTL